MPFTDELESDTTPSPSPSRLLAFALPILKDPTPKSQIRPNLFPCFQCHLTHLGVEARTNLAGSVYNSIRGSKANVQMRMGSIRKSLLVGMTGPVQGTKRVLLDGYAGQRSPRLSFGHDSIL